mgnify:CR=1 FL=1
MEEEKPILQEIEDKKEKWISRISLWVSVLLTTAIVIWYYQSNPPESPEVVRMRVFFKEKNRDVMKFISMDRNEQIAFAFKRSEEHTSELQSRTNLVCRLLLEKKKKKNT